MPNLQSKGLATEKSRIKMRVFTTKKEENKCWYSPAKENKKPTAVIIEGMKQRFQKNISEGKLTINARINVVIFYDMFNGETELERFKN
jgi:hypothetical protein